MSNDNSPSEIARRYLTVTIGDLGINIPEEFSQQATPKTLLKDAVLLRDKESAKIFTKLATELEVVKKQEAGSNTAKLDIIQEALQWLKMTVMVQKVASNPAVYKDPQDAAGMAFSPILNFYATTHQKALDILSPLVGLLSAAKQDILPIKDWRRSPPPSPKGRA